MSAWLLKMLQPSKATAFELPAYTPPPCERMGQQFGESTCIWELYPDGAGRGATAHILGDLVVADVAVGEGCRSATIHPHTATSLRARGASRGNHVHTGATCGMDMRAGVGARTMAVFEVILQSVKDVFALEATTPWLSDIVQFWNDATN